MLFGKYKSLITDLELENIKEEYQKAKRVGQYKVSTSAFFQPDGGYLPASAIKEVQKGKTSVHVTGCCAGGVPVEQLIFVTESNKFSYIFDTEKQLEKALEIMQLG